MKEKYDWRYNDTAAIMFSAIDTSSASRIYRMAAVLKDEKVDPGRLKKAVALTMPLFPVFSYRSVNGMFWAYLEKAKGLPYVGEEKFRPALSRRLGNDGSPEVNVLYYDRRISLEINHIYCDGTGAFEVLKSIVAHYLILGGADKKDFEGVKLDGDEITRGEVENPYARYAHKSAGKKIEHSGAWNDALVHAEKGYLNYITGQLEINALKNEAKKYSMTITEYIAAVIIKTAIDMSMSPIRQNIIVDIPSNMRKLLPSESNRNFSSDLVIVFNPEGRTDYTLGEICVKVSGQLKKLHNEESYYGFINKNYGMTQNKFLQIIPFFIKHPGLDLIQKNTHTDGMSFIFLNMGSMKMPAVMSEKIERIDFCGGDAGVYNMTTFMSATGLNGYMNMSLSCNTRENTFYKNFFRVLASQGIPVRAESSECPRSEDENEIYPKTCTECGVRTGEEYTCCPLCSGKLSKSDSPDEYFRTSVYPREFEKPSRTRRKHSIYPPSLEQAKAFFSLKCCDLDG